MINPELAAFVQAENALRSTAERALRVKTDRASRAIVREVVAIAELVLPVVSEFEGIDNAYELARNALTLPRTETNADRVEYTLRSIDHIENQANAEQAA